MEKSSDGSDRMSMGIGMTGPAGAKGMADAAGKKGMAACKGGVASTVVGMVGEAGDERDFSGFGWSAWSSEWRLSEVSRLDILERRSGRGFGRKLSQ